MGFLCNKLCDLFGYYFNEKQGYNNKGGIYTQ